ncbi:ArsB/NhaD family transporter [Kineosporia mesophila]|uniref:ArsB/NhaD family transporter n=1 Tax=Kineosporia mesophila TaxID=566012 RepID=A0ABP6ZG07_9ACTN|nr:SLC13 family permease [Kineosporia mesophila]MCD5350176.1 arsenic transporter [Kineosporia mesophila]
MWLVLAVGGVLVVLTGWLPRAQAYDVAVERALPVLGFLVAITILADLAEKAGVFDAAARVAARLARGSTLRLFLLIAALGVLTTVGMSLDTTAVLLTPVVLTVTDKLGLRPMPFALLVVWLANTASLLLPVSNLTNLLAISRLDMHPTQFLARMALPELACVLVTVFYLWLIHRRDLRGSFDPPEHVPPPNRWTFRICALACLALAPGVVAGLEPWVVAVPCALAAVTVFAVRTPSVLGFWLLPWRIVLLTEGLFLVVTALTLHGGRDLIEHLAGQSTLATVITAAGASNLVNNLPAYLAVESAVPPGHTTQLLGALIGTNAGPLVLLWGSLATLLWRERCRQRGVEISALRFGLVGLGGLPLILLAGWATLLVTS